MGCRSGRTSNPHPTLPAAPMVEGGGHHCPPHARHSVLQLIKYQSMQSKVRLVYDREPQRSLSKDFIFPSARVSSTGCTHWASRGNTEPLCSDAARGWSQA